MNFRLILFFILLILDLVSCTRFLKTFENYQDIDELYKKEKDKKSRLQKNSKKCSISSDLEVVTNDQAQSDSLHHFLEQQKNKFSFIEKAVILSLFQLHYRPDLTNPQSRSQFIFYYNNQRYFFDFPNQNIYRDNPYPYLAGLQEILTQFKSSKNIFQIYDEFKLLYQAPIFIDKELSEFINQEYQKLTLDDELSSYYTRSDEALKKDEKMPDFHLFKNFRLDPNFNSVKDKIFKQQAILSKSEYKLTQYKSSKKQIIECNVDLNEYDQSHFFITNLIKKSNLFMLRENNFFFAGISTHDEFLVPFNHTIAKSPFIKIKAESQPIPICFITDPKTKSQYWLIASHSRDPGQHLHNIVNYQKGEFTPKELKKIIEFSRHLFLLNPLRLSFEAKRARPAQTRELLNLNIPVYNAEKIGKVWGSLLKTDASPIITLDNRENGFTSCHKN